MWTNKEIVQHLQQFPGEIHTESFPLPAGNRFRVEHKYRLRNIPFNPDQAGVMVEVEEDQYPPPPYNLTLYKGIKSYRLPRQFVTFLLTHPVARDYIDWVMFTAHAEEHTVATLAWISNMTLDHNGVWQVTQNKQPQVESSVLNLRQLLFVHIGQWTSPELGHTSMSRLH